MERITVRHVRGAMDRLMRAAERQGIDTNGWQIESGSVTYGRAWKLVKVDPDNGGHHSVFATNGYLGMTAREAYSALQHYAQVFDFLNYPTGR